MINKNRLYGFGTHRLKDEECVKAVTRALKYGYNLIDTAEKYNNSKEIGLAIKKSKRDRNSFMIVHKLTDVLEFSRTKEETFSKVRGYLKELDTHYLDVLLMHGPSPRYHEEPELFKEGNIVVWKAMIDLKNMGVVKEIGVSNFNKEQIMYLIDATGVAPDYSEVEFNVLNYDEVKAFKAWTDNLKIKTIAYSPLAAGRLHEISNNYLYLNQLKYLPNLTAAEFALHFNIQQGVISIPRSSNKARIKDNLTILKAGYDTYGNTSL